MITYTYSQIELALAQELAVELVHIAHVLLFVHVCIV